MKISKFLIITATILLTACSRIAPISIPSESHKLSSDRTKQLLSQLIDKAALKKTARALYKIKISTPTSNQSIRMAVIADKEKKKLRIDLLPPTGFYNLASISIQNGFATIKDYSTNIVETKEATNEVLEEMIGLPLTLEDVWSVIEKSPMDFNLARGSAWICYEDIGITCRTTFDKSVKDKSDIVFLVNNEKLSGVDVQIKQQPIRVRYEIKEIEDESGITIAMPAKLSEVVLIPTKVAWNEELKDGVFEIK